MSDKTIAKFEYGDIVRGKKGELDRVLRTWWAKDPDSGDPVQWMNLDLWGHVLVDGWSLAAPKTLQPGHHMVILTDEMLEVFALVDAIGSDIGAKFYKLNPRFEGESDSE